MKKLLFVIVSILLYACETNLDKLGGYKIDYDSALEHFIVLDKSDANCNNILGYKHPGSFVKFYTYDGDYKTLCIDSGSTVIYSDVDEAISDDNYILVSQKPLNQICECNQKCLQNKYKNWANMKTYEMCKEALKKSKYYQYWIIRKNVNEVYGPLTKSQYIVKRRLFNINSTLELKN